METKDVKNTDRNVISAVKSWIEQFAEGITVRIEHLPEAPEKLPSIGLQTMTGNPIVRPYKGGGAVMAYRFSIWLRVPIHREANHVDALTLLNKIVDAAEAYEVPELPENYTPWRVACDSLPALYGANDLYEDYQCMFTFEYQFRR